MERSFPYGTLPRFVVGNPSSPILASLRGDIGSGASRLRNSRLCRSSFQLSPILAGAIRTLNSLQSRPNHRSKVLSSTFTTPAMSMHSRPPLRSALDLTMSGISISWRHEGSPVWQQLLGGLLLYSRSVLNRDTSMYTD